MELERKKITFIGSRGIPTLHGGFETFVEEVSKEIQKNTDFEIVVIGDKEQKKQTNNLLTFNNIELKYSKYSKQNSPSFFI